MITHKYKTIKELPAILMAFYYGNQDTAIELYVQRFGCPPEVCWQLDDNYKLWRFELPEESE